ncbi:uncharacterized protein LOC108327310 [Vigna angularis]|uniref:uncharacterized protein LOC108327310 n=1 Tax=Phaseolus angularis TaxID=3914 RepID=UPI0022B4BAB7|nr:uncharacterized protein LOC108327310 [Vigna angularis]
MKIFKKLEINIPFSKALQQMPSYSKFLKELLTKKRKYIEEETIEVQGNCSAIIQKLLPPKFKDPGSFTIPCTIGNISVGKALIDLGANINLMPLSMFEKVEGLELKPTWMTLQLVDTSLKYPYRLAEDVLVKTVRVLIDVENGKLKVRVQDEEVNFDVFKAMSHPKDDNECFHLDSLDEICMIQENNASNTLSLEEILVDTCEELNEKEEELMDECLTDLEELQKVPLQNIEEKVKGSKVELKMLPPHLKYAFLEEGGNKPVIISNSLSPKEEEKLVEILKANKGAIGWSISDLKGISPTYYMHKIFMEDDCKPVAQPQRRLNPVMKKEAIFAELIEKCIEVFMDDFSVFGSSFHECLSNLDVVLKRCTQSNLVLNWEKCHFMVNEGIVLGHKISSKGIEVDRAKVEVIEKLPPPTNVKGIRSFLGHVGFYRRFIKDFSKIAKPLSNLLVKDAQFVMDDECLKAFDVLRKKLISASVIVSPDWNQDFELMCDAINYAIGAVLGQRREKPDSKPRLIRWVLLLQEFDVEIRDKKGSKNVIANHLSRLVNNEVTRKEEEIWESFSDETLMYIQQRPWFADMANFKAVGVIP